MNDKNIILKKSASKTQWLSFGIILGLAIALSSISSGCEKEEADVYYVKYYVDSSNINTGGELYVIFTTEQNEELALVFDQNTKWETTIGPVSKGFNAKIRTSNKTDTEGLRVYSQIDVSKNNSPFAFKKSDSPPTGSTYDNSTLLEYTIDY